MSTDTIGLGVADGTLIKITRDERGQWSATCQHCGTTMGTFRPDTVGRWMEEHWVIPHAYCDCGHVHTDEVCTTKDCRCKMFTREVIQHIRSIERIPEQKEARDWPVALAFGLGVYLLYAYAIIT